MRKKSIFITLFVFFLAVVFFKIGPAHSFDVFNTYLFSEHVGFDKKFFQLSESTYLYAGIILQNADDPAAISPAVTWNKNSTNNLRYLNYNLGYLNLDAILRNWNASGTPFSFPEDVFQILKDGAVISVEAWDLDTQVNPPTLKRSSIFVTQTLGQRCEGDFDFDGGVDGYDLSVFVENFGRVNCSSH